MRHIPLLAGVSLAAVAIGAGPAFAQQNLPTIDIGGARGPAIGGAPGRPQDAGRPAANRAPARVAEPARAPMQAPTQTGVAETDPKAYRAGNASTALKMNIPIMDTPASVQVVPQAVLQDQQVTRIEQAARNVSGVTQVPSNQGGSDAFMIRGFLTDTIYRDGFLTPGTLGGGTSKRDTANIERVEVLKGPGSILYGRAEPGGIINFVTKLPLAERRYALQQQFGSFGFYRTTLDATGPVTADKSILYRVNIAYENAHSFRDFMKNNRVFIAPVVSWLPDEHTRVNLEFEYQHYNDAVDPGLPPYGTLTYGHFDPNAPAAIAGRVVQPGGPAPVPRSRYMSEPLSSRSFGDRYLFGFNWTRQLNENWTLKHRFVSELYNMGDASSLFWFQPVTAGGALNRNFNLVAPGEISNRFYTSVNLTGKVDTFGVKHNLLFGYDYFNIRDFLYNDCCAAAPAFNIFAPTYLPYPVYANPLNYFRIDYKQSWSGYYFQDQMELPYNVFLMGGFRYDDAVGLDNGTGPASQYVPARLTTRDNRISPRAGILWRALPWLSVYGSYTENFGVSNSLFRGPLQKMVPGQTARQWEGGAKTELLGGRLLATGAFFDLTKNNIGVTDPVDPFNTRLIGEAHSQGVEFDVSGEILPGWRVIAAYTHLTDAKTTRDTGFDGGPGATGKRLFLAPRNSGSLWTTYEFPTYDIYGMNLAGLKFGGGVQGQDGRYGDPMNTYYLPSYAVFNLMAAYSFKVMDKKLTAQLNVENLFNRTYFVGTNTGSFITPGAPTSLLGSLKLEF